MNRRGRPLGIWKNRLREFNEREKGIGRGDGLEHEKGECLDRESWRIWRGVRQQIIRWIER